MLCAKDLKRTDNLNRHLALCHKNREEYSGYKECTNFSFSCAGDDYPHLFIAEKRGVPNQYVGYCTGCYKAVAFPKYVRTLESACKHIKEHCCVGKQVRTRKVTVVAEGVSGNITVKQEMQTGGVKITEETLDSWKQQYPRFEIKCNENLDYDIMGTLRKAVIDSHLLDAVKTQQKQAPAAEVAPVSGDIYLQVMQSFVGDKVIGAMMAADIKAEQDKALEVDDDDSDCELQEPDYRKALRSRLVRTKILQEKVDRAEAAAKDVQRIHGDLEDAVERERSKVKQVQLQMEQERASAARREQERDDEIRILRAALQQHQSKIELVVDDKKF